MDLSSLAVLKDFPIVYAFAIGVITAIGPCPLSANVTAIAYVSSKFTDSKGTILAGSMYTLGRAVTYSIIGIMVYMFGSAVMSAGPELQNYEKIIIGPVLILTGAIMLGLVRPAFSVGDGLKSKYGIKLSDKGILGAFGLGVVFALAFCPYTAVMFFGMLIPLALNSDVLGISYPLVFGVGTGLPVLIFAVLLGTSAAFAKAYLARITKIEPYIRKVLGAGFIIFGLYMIVEYFI